jgi:type IV pilus assembly protein PilO
MKLLLDIIRARRKSFIFLGILLALNLLLAAYLLLRQNPRMEELQVRRNEQQRLLASGGGDISGQYHQGVTDLATFRDRAPQRKSFARVVGEILEAAQNSGLVVSGITYKPNPVAGGGLVDYSLSFSVAGKYAGVKSYFADLQRFKELVVVDQFSLAGGRTTEEMVDLKLTLTIYLQAVTP